MPAYQTKHESIAITGVDNLHIRSLLDRGQFSDPLGEAANLGISSAAWPLFGLLWPSGARLAALVALRPVGTERILEIGCGLALASLVSHRRGGDVTASDCHPMAAPFLAENLRLNGLASLPYRHGHWHVAGALHGPLPGALAPAVVEGLFDLVMGSDVLYERDDGGALAGFIGRHTQPAAEVWIIDPDRGNRTAFTRQMASGGFALTEERLDTPATLTALAYKGRLLRFRRGLPA